MVIRRFLTSLVTLTAAAGLTACGSDDSSANDTTAATASGVESSGSAGLSEAEVEFAQGMIAHHEQAIEMAEIALDPDIGASAAVVDLATRIRDAQDPEVDLMTGWLNAAGEPVTMDESEGHEMESMDGMMTAGQMDSLAATSGGAFDQTWLSMMIAHHEGAISQSEAVTADGANTDVLALADQIITTQQAEIAEMEGLLQG